MREYTRQEQEAAAVAAKLIAAEGRTWARAFRDAQRSVGIRPDPNLTASEIRRWFALFAPHEHQALLAAKRHAALHVMRSVPELNCRLIGVVLSGAAVETSPAELVAIGTGEKEAFLALLNAGFCPNRSMLPTPPLLPAASAKNVWTLCCLTCTANPFWCASFLSTRRCRHSPGPMNFKPSGKLPAQFLRMRSPKFSQTPPKPQP